ncbi:MAG TPA: phosphatase PAP2 family protein [Bdellovibrio sp.]|uniref:phosphatase PAP2 family protein n=1 Tax=Bdellovibrio sp. TaxID=28201 RepID=UPI002EE5496B
MEVYAWEEAIMTWARSLPHTGMLYEFFKFWSDQKESFPLLFLFALTLGIEFGWRKLLTPTVLSILAVICGDLFSRRVVKFFVERPRPNFVHDATCTMSKCWGFVSSHCTNVAAVAVVLCLYNKRNAIWTIPSVILVAISRIYLIDHYPLDVIGGVILGILIGIAIYIGYLQYRVLKQKPIEVKAKAQ